MEDEDFFSDDDFADITDNALQALEQNAIVSTQRPRTANPSQTIPSATQTSRKQPHNATSLNRPSIRNGSGKLPWRPPQPRPGFQMPSQLQAASVRLAGAPELPLSDYGLEEETVIDLDAPTTAGLAGVSGRDRQHAEDAMDAETMAAFAAADAELDAQMSRHSRNNGHAPAQSMDVSALQAKIAALEAEQRRLQQSEREARALAQTKQGEIQIVRAKLDNSTKNFESRLAAMQKQHVDEVAKQKAELEAGRREREQMETDNRFLHHDLAQEAERARRLTGPGRVRALASGRAETPRKSKRSATGVGDGFDDAEVQTVSPSRSKDRSREQTPKAGSKRKRPAQDSPIPLALTQPPQQLRKEDSLQTNTSFDLAAPLAPEKARNGIFEFSQSILTHRPCANHDRTFEALTKFAFPSNPDKTLASLFMDRISQQRAPDTETFALSTATIMLDFWSLCLREKYFSPLYLILDMVRFSLRHQLSAVLSSLIEKALPVCIRSTDMVADEIAKASTWGADYAATIDWDAHSKLSDQIQVDEVLDFLHDLCQAAALSPERSTRFWRNMELTFMLQMLNKAQPVRQIITMLNIVSLSSTEESFGVVLEDVMEQNKQENDVIDRLTNLLFEAPIVPRHEPDYTTEEVTELRIAVLKVFAKMCESDHGGLLLAKHRSTIGRLVRFLDSQISKLYTTPLVPRFDGDKNASPSPHELISQTINMATRILYHLLRTYEDSIDIVQKLRAVLGGYHKFLVGLSRIAFSEQLVFESGIEDAAAEAAHAILDRILGPDDGEAVMKAIETPRSGGGSTLRSGRETSVMDVG